MESLSVIGVKGVVMNKARVCHVISRFKGDYPLFDRAVAGLKELGYSQCVVFLAGGLPEDAAIRKIGCKIHLLNPNRERLRGLNPRSILRLRHVIKDFDAQILHAHRHKATIYSALAAIGTTTSVFSTVHALTKTRNLRRKVVNRLLLPRVTGIIAVSEAVRRDILDTNPCLSKDKVKVVYNGIDLKLFAPGRFSKEAARKAFGISGFSGPVFGTAGRLVLVKGHDVLLKAWASSGLQEQGGLLLFAGEGREESRLKQLAADLGVEESVKFLGHLREIHKFYAAIDCFVFPSRKEGHPLALIEAMASGLPVITTNVGGIPEVLGSLAGLDGALMVKHDDTEALSGAIKVVAKLIKDRERLEKVRSLLVKRAGLFSYSSMIQQLDGLYSNVLIN